MFALCILFAIPYTVQAQTAYCPADLNLDRFVNSADLGKILLDFGHCPGCSSDLNLDEHVNSADLGLMLVDFGNCPDDNGGSDCPPYRTFKQPGYADKYCNEFNQFIVGYRTWEIYYSGTGQSPDCQTFQTGNDSYCFPDQTLIGTNNNRDYFADGNCGCYSRPVVDPPGCPKEGSDAGADLNFQIKVTPHEGGCGDSFQVGLGARRRYHDGNCNTFWGLYCRVWWWYEYGFRIGGCKEYTFYSNGSGGYYSQRNCEPSGTLISSSSDPIIADGWTVGTATINVYADGNCGTYQDSSSSYLSYGTFLGSDSTYNYYSDGSGWYYTELIGGGCDSNGTFISSSSEPIIAGGWTVGTTTINVYADGNCGTYQDSSNSYLSYGTFLGSDGTYNYYSDGYGGYYTDMPNYNIVRFMPVSQRTLLHKKNTYIPYISLPVPFQTKPIK